MARSNLVFTGTAMSSTDPMAGSPVVSSIDPITWTFEVGSTEKGPASGIQLVSTARDGGSCGFSFVAGKRYQVFATRNGAGYSTSLCSGTHDLALAADPFTPSTTWAVFPITVGALALASALAILLDVRRTQRSRVG